MVQLVQLELECLSVERTTGHQLNSARLYFELNTNTIIQFTSHELELLVNFYVGLFPQSLEVPKRDHIYRVKMHLFLVPKQCRTSICAVKTTACTYLSKHFAENERLP